MNNHKSYYKKVLVALELEPKSDKRIINKALELREQFNCQLILVHGVEYLSNYGGAASVPVGVDIAEELLKEAKKMMSIVGERLKVDAAHQKVSVGSPKYIIQEEAKNAHVDLIVIGSHGRHGIRLLLGSTANAVLHGAECDVLAVRVEE